MHVILDRKVALCYQIEAEPVRLEASWESLEQIPHHYAYQEWLPTKPSR
jgi:hypothetical protein